MSYHRDTIEHEGHKFRIELVPDDCGEAPWDREDGHGPVSDWKRHAFGRGTKPPKAPGEMILHWDSGSYRVYDFQAAVKQAKAEGWDTAPYGQGTKGERAHRAAMADFNRLRDWCNDRWQYVGVVVHLLDDEGDDMGESESLWGVESDSPEYIEETAHELAGEILHRLTNQLRAA